jgi:hypothetical protein
MRSFGWINKREIDTSTRVLPNLFTLVVLEEGGGLIVARGELCKNLRWQRSSNMSLNTQDGTAVKADWYQLRKRQSSPRFSSFHASVVTSLLPVYPAHLRPSKTELIVRNLW